MDTRARLLLEKLLLDGEKNAAGVRSRVAALTLANLAEYRQERSLRAKEAFETTMQAARAQRAVNLTWDDSQEGNGFISRVDLVDRRELAAFLGETPLADVLSVVSAQLRPHQARHPVLQDVLDRWGQLRKVRTLSPSSVDDWLDAIRVIEAAGVMIQGGTSIPIREASYRIFKDSKRIEKLTGPMDVLLVGSVEAAPREPAAVWAELGLFREEHPALLAGNVVLRRERVTSVLDNPYTGLPAATVLGMSSSPRMVMSIENLTTFHSEAKRSSTEDVLLLYTAGMPSPAWRAMYGRLLKDVPTTIPIYHWGDVDEGGFRIAATLARDALLAGHTLCPWKMHPDDIPDEVRRKATPYVLGRMRHYAAAAGWTELGDAVLDAGFTVEQEGQS